MVLLAGPRQAGKTTLANQIMKHQSAAYYTFGFLMNLSGFPEPLWGASKQKPWIACEVKLDDKPLDSNLKYFLERVHVPYAFQVSLKGLLDYRPADINGCKVRICPASLFLANLP